MAKKKYVAFKNQAPESIKEANLIYSDKMMSYTQVIFYLKVSKSKFLRIMFQNLQIYQINGENLRLIN